MSEAENSPVWQNLFQSIYDVHYGYAHKLHQEYNFGEGWLWQLDSYINAISQRFLATALLLAVEEDENVIAINHHYFERRLEQISYENEWLESFPDSLFTIQAIYERFFILDPFNSDWQQEIHRIVTSPSYSRIIKHIRHSSNDIRMLTDLLIFSTIYLVKHFKLIKHLRDVKFEKKFNALSSGQQNLFSIFTHPEDEILNHVGSLLVDLQRMTSKPCQDNPFYKLPHILRDDVAEERKSILAEGVSKEIDRIKSKSKNEPLYIYHWIHGFTVANMMQKLQEVARRQKEVQKIQTENPDNKIYLSDKLSEDNNNLTIEDSLESEGSSPEDGIYEPFLTEDEKEELREEYGEIGLRYICSVEEEKEKLTNQEQADKLKVSCSTIEKTRKKIKTTNDGLVLRRLLTIK